MNAMFGRLTVGALAIGASIASAQVIYGPPTTGPAGTRGWEGRVRTPVVGVRVGSDPYRPSVVAVARPVLTYAQPGPAPQLRPVPVDRGYFPPAPPPPQAYVPAVPVPQPAAGYVAARPMTHREFASCFVPTCGTHEAWLIHPKTCQPVRVCFTLPHGTPRKVRVERNELEFDYGRQEVEIRFRNDGTVKVEYNR